MVNAISSGSGDVAAASTVKKQENIQDAVGVSMLKKAMDTQSNATLQLLQKMGVGGNVDAFA